MTSVAARIAVNVRKRDWRWLWLRRRDRWVEIFRGPVEQWTPEEHDNAMKYGVCPTCGAPRHARISYWISNGKQVYAHGIACPNGHPQ